MLINIIQEYDKEKISFLVNLWTETLTALTKKEDQKKITSFLGKCGIIGIDEKHKKVYIGVPNEFVLTQVKKFFLKTLTQALHEVYNPYVKVEFTLFEGFQAKKRHDLQIDVTTVCKNTEVKENKAKATISKKMKSKLTDSFGILFHPDYTFENCISGSHNELAYNAAQAISENPGKVYNPFYVYGNVGLGKTLLMQSIGNAIMKKHPEKVIVYLPATKLIDEIVESVKKNKLSNMMKKFEDVDVLLIDDVQFLADKTKTQEIFHNIFNDFHMQHKQIVLNSDCAPKELNNMADRLKSRFALGLVADIGTPDMETRIAILESKIEQKGVEMPREFLEIIAKHVCDNVRELEGALNLLITKQTFHKEPLSEKDVYATMKTLGYKITAPTEKASVENHRSANNFNDLAEYVANYYTIDLEEIKGDSRKKEVSYARQMLMFIAKHHFNWTLEKIGNYFGGKNHATVIYAINTIEHKIKTEDQADEDYATIKSHFDFQ